MSCPDPGALEDAFPWEQTRLSKRQTHSLQAAGGSEPLWWVSWWTEPAGQTLGIRGCCGSNQILKPTTELLKI
jgi:hypothetical protein